MVHQVTKSGATIDNEWQRVKKSDNKWQRVVQRMKMNESEWEQIKESGFGFRTKKNMQCVSAIYSTI